MNKTYPEESQKTYSADWIRNQYLNTPTSNKVERNRLFLMLYDIWLPYVLSRVKSLPYDARDEILQIYRYRILEAVSKFKAKNKATFKSYLYYAAFGALTIYNNYNNKIRFEYEMQDIDLLDHVGLNKHMDEMLYTHEDYVGSSI